jgi:hypothetical protein
MSNNEELMQLRFEQQIELLIMYKKNNTEKDVFLSEKSIKMAVDWYKNKILKNIKQ